jgi:hypothetical protein
MVLYDNEMNIIETEKTWLNNQWTVKFTAELTAGTYYVMTYYENTTGGNTLELSISHYHTLDEYVYYDETFHIEACGCGMKGTYKGVHVVESVGLAERMAPCIDCGTMIDIFNNHFPSIMSITKYSVNGSYILPNGIIVLVEEDVEAYLNGTLVFYDKDKLPVTQ